MDDEEYFQYLNTLLNTNDYDVEQVNRIYDDIVNEIYNDQFHNFRTSFNALFNQYGGANMFLI